VLYTATTGSTISNITICNTSAADAVFSLGISKGGGVLANGDYLYKGTTVPANDSITRVAGDVLENTDELRVSDAEAANTFSYSVSLVEVT